MIKVGEFNTLSVVKIVPFGVYLNGGEWGEILLPNKVTPKGTQIDDQLNVFIYFDSEDKIIATTVRPLARVGRCAFLKVIDVNRIGAFLAWGLDKDVLVPLSEQYLPMEKDKSYLVYLKLDQQGRIIASSKLDYFLDQSLPVYHRGDEVMLLIAQTSGLGTKVIINDRHWGLIHASDLFQSVGYGQKIHGYIKAIREDGKIDVVLRKIGQESRQDLTQKILAALHKADGFLPLHDKSPALDIQRAFNESKKSFKSAIGMLYKQGEIQLEDNGIRLKKKTEDKGQQ